MKKETNIKTVSFSLTLRYCHECTGRFKRINIFKHTCKRWTSAIHNFLFFSTPLPLLLLLNPHCLQVHD